MSKHFLFLGMSACLMSSGVYAQTKTYEPSDDIIGQVTGVSDNGRFAVASDMENNLGYLWTIDNPTEFTPISSSTFAKYVATDVADDGTVAGYVVNKDGTSRPALYKDGEFIMLPVHEAVLNTAEANCITPDGKVIAGTMFLHDKTSEINGRYYPCQWTLDDNGEYVLKSYVDIDLPDHQGFLSMAQTPDGKIIGGRLYCGAGSNVGALIEDGQLKYFHELDTKLEPFLYRGKYEGRDEDGKQIWLDDPNDPRIVLYEEYYIDGYHDGATGQYFDGEFSNCDTQGNFYGARTQAIDVTENGEGTLINSSCVYNMNNGEWTDNSSFITFLAGIGNDIIFTSNASVIINGEDTKLSSLGVQTSHFILGVPRISADAKILGGVSYDVHPGTGERIYYPFVTVLESGLAVDGIADNSSAPVFNVGSGVINVTGAESVAVYDLEGRLVSRASSSNVAPGVYVVKADDTVRKVFVK